VTRHAGLHLVESERLETFGDDARRAFLAV
jgi:hypothetical protein